MAERILVVEDEPDILELMEYNLTRVGYQVTCAADGEEGVVRARRETPDLILLDLMLPKLDGMTVCRELRATPALRSVPIIMVTARGQEEDVVSGLEAGADDYVIKPFGVKVLLARVKAALRRAPANADGRIVRGGLVVDPERHLATVDGEELTLTATEFRVLRSLATQPGRVFTRDQLVDRAIGRNALVTDRNIDVHVGALRKKLGERRDLIETIRGVGYRFRDL